MLLGKRTRPPMKRTTSMTDFTLDVNVRAEGVYQPLDPHNTFNGGGGAGRLGKCLSRPAAASPKLYRRNSADFVETSHFLRVCSLCKRRLIPGRDIYMYRGDGAFCSLECRQQQMTRDERKNKYSLASKKETATTVTTVHQVSATGETISAV